MSMENIPCAPIPTSSADTKLINARAMWADDHVPLLAASTNRFGRLDGSSGSTEKMAAAAEMKKTKSPVL